MGDSAELSHTRAALLALLFGLAGAAANFVPLPIGIGVSFLLGPAFGLTAVMLLGAGWGTLSALLAAAATWHLWNHPAGLALFGLESLWVGAWLRLGRRNVVLIDAAFWFLAGPPLCWLLLHLLVGTSGLDTLTVLLKLGVNGVLLALIASAAMTHLPLAARLGVGDGPRRVSFAQILFHLTAAALLVPAVCLLLFSSYRASESVQREVIDVVGSECLESGQELEEWLEAQLRGVRAAARIHAEPEPGSMPPPFGVPPRSLPQEVELGEIRELFPAVASLSLAGPDGRPLAADPPLPEPAPARVGVELAALHGAGWPGAFQQARVSGVFSRPGFSGPVIELAAPRIEGGQLRAIAFGLLRTEALQALLQRGAAHKNLWSTVLDGGGRVVATTHPRRRPLDVVPSQEPGARSPQIGPVTLLMPQTSRRSGAYMSVWREAVFQARRPLAGTDWTLLLESPLGPVQDSLLLTARQSLAGVAVLLLFALLAARSVSRALAELPARFAVLSRDLPYRLGASATISWPESPVEELALLIANFRQVTEALGRTMDGLRRNEQLLVQQARHAAVGEALGAIAHQWRQPLNALGLVLQNLRDAFLHGELDREHLERSLGKARLQLQHLSKTIDDFRSFSLPDRQTTVFPLRDLFREVLALYQPQLEASRVSVDLGCRESPGGPLLAMEPGAACDLVVDGPRNAFGHAILNLLNNAREAIVDQRKRTGPEGQPARQGSIRVVVSRLAERLRIEVSDDGGGIPQDALETIFEPYHSTKGPSRGTGLGLYMCKRIVEEHMAGTIAAANGETGAIFTIELPAARPEVRR